MNSEWLMGQHMEAINCDLFLECQKHYGKSQPRWPMFWPRFEPVSFQIQVRNFTGVIPLCFYNLIILIGWFSQNNFFIIRSIFLQYLATCFNLKGCHQGTAIKNVDLYIFSRLLPLYYWHEHIVVNWLSTVYLLCLCFMWLLSCLFILPGEKS
jgi:hypothetical protein